MFITVSDSCSLFSIGLELLDFNVFHMFEHIAECVCLCICVCGDGMVVLIPGFHTCQERALSVSYSAVFYSGLHPQFHLFRFPTFIHNMKTNRKLWQ